MADENLDQARKGDHIEICMKENVDAEYNYWQDLRLIHNALPEIDMDDIDISTKLFGANLEAPIIISAITGGTREAERINANLASAAARLGIGMGVGSQRAAIRKKELASTYSVVKQYDIPLVIANVGAPQLVPQGKDNNKGTSGWIKGKKGDISLDEAREAMEMIDADVLAVHLNFLQEVVQPEGDTNALGVLDAFRGLASKLPVIAKETGAGISGRTAMALKKAGVTGFDVGGLGGTSFAAVEYYRAQAKGDKVRARLGKTFWSWGIPTPVSVIEAALTGLPIIATGGVNTGLDAAKAIVVGADCAGIAKKLLKPAVVSAEAVEEELRMIVRELKAAMFLIGARDLSDLRGADAIITGMTRTYLEELELSKNTIRQGKFR